MLKPQPPAKPSIELLAQAPTMDNNRLEKLVKNFVVEDKARLAARNKPMPSSIQYALQKFEKNAQNDATFVKKTTPSRPNSYTPSSPTSSPVIQVSQSCEIIVSSDIYIAFAIRTGDALFGLFRREYRLIPIVA